MSSPEYFADTSFWIALLNKRDQHQARAVAWLKHITLKAALVVTTQPVLWETLNALSAPAIRTVAAQFYRGCTRDGRVIVVDFESALTESAINLFESRHDKEWSLTDCFSLVAMERHQLRLALTADHHFVQAGFDALLLRDPPPDAD